MGHIVWLSLDPRRGREQAGRRPFLVLTPSAYNDKTSLVVGCPVTSQIKGYPFEVPLADETGVAGSVSGVVLADQVKSLDWRKRRADFAGEVSHVTLNATRSLIAILLELSER
ncbi:MAG TPA: type II toxin-antitoxin system PemK/MazF family toxin [Candidatus Elarobacter sp.]